MRAIDRFCNRFPRFGIPHLIRYIVFGTGLVFIYNLISDDATLISYLFFSSSDILSGQVWRLFSFIFIPTQSHPVWLAVTLFVTYMLGSALEQIWGTAKFNVFFLFNILVFAAAGMIIHFAAPMYAWGTTFFVNGYYIQSFLIFTFITLAPSAPFMLSFVIPIQAKWLGIIMALGLAYTLFYEMRLFFPLNLFPLVLLIPYLIFCGDILFGYLKRSRPMPSKTAVNFHSTSKKIEREKQKKAYTRKCEVCGKTDADYPDMEFRYCSRCDGYHCFCIDHINNHTHYIE